MSYGEGWLSVSPGLHVPWSAGGHRSLLPACVPLTCQSLLCWSEDRQHFPAGSEGWQQGQPWGACSSQMKLPEEGGGALHFYETNWLLL